jgi:signal peptidase II
MSRLSRLSRAAQLSILFLFLATCVGCDQAAKLMATEHLSDAQPISFLNGLVRFEYAENSGAFLSLGSRLPPSARFLLLEVMVGALLLFGLFVTVFSNRMSLRQKAVLALAMGGGLGNLIDRVLHGAVVDFVSLGIGPLRTGIFNLADVAITVGMIGILWLTGTEPAPTTPAGTVRSDD